MFSFQTVWQPYSPESLVNICVKFCIQNPCTFCSYDPVRSEYVLREGVTLPAELCERMLQVCKDELDRDRVVDDSFIKLFKNPECTRLCRVDLHDASITDIGMEIIMKHPIVELDISNCCNLTKRTLHLINTSRTDLISLTVGNSVQIFPESLYCGEQDLDGEPRDGMCEEIEYIIVAPNLRKLVIRDFEVPKEADYCRRLFCPLRNLSHLDLSSCCHLGDLSYLSSLRHLVSLILYNVPRLQEVVPALCELKSLRHLDVSQSGEKHGHYTYPNQVLQRIVDSLPHLTSLDISGTNLAGSGVLERSSPVKANGNSADQVPLTDIPGLKNRVHRPLEFLGLFYTSHEACYRHHIPAIRIAGEANEEQILTAAQAYYDRPEILQKVLNDLFHIFRYETCKNSRLALDVVMVAMRRHLREKHIQIAGSASLFYIVKGEEKNNFNIGIKRKIIKVLLDAMCTHRFDTTMLRNGCLTLTNFRIPQDVLFDYERLVVILLHIVSQDNQDEFVQRIGIFLLNSLACQVDGYQKRLVGERGAIVKMLSLIQGRLRQNKCDEVMEMAWSTMWNVTDETPINCRKFLDGGGMDLFLGCLRAFPEKPELLRNMMGLLGNVAEVKSLRPMLMKDDYITVFSELLDSTSDGIEVSYNAAGILSHIASDGPELWIQHNICAVRREHVLQRMVSAIERWDLKTKRNINYRSFEPILRLLHVDHTPEAQHWAVWALANLTRVYWKKYCPLLIEEGGIELLQELIRKPQPYCRIKELAGLIIKQCMSYQKRGHLDDGSQAEDLWDEP